MLPFILCNKKRLPIRHNDTIDSVIQHREVGRAKDLSAPPRNAHRLAVCRTLQLNYFEWILSFSYVWKHLFSFWVLQNFNLFVLSILHIDTIRFIYNVFYNLLPWKLIWTLHVTCVYQCSYKMAAGSPNMVAQRPAYIDKWNVPCDLLVIKLYPYLYANFCSHPTYSEAIFSIILFVTTGTFDHVIFYVTFL